MKLTKRGYGLYQVEGTNYWVEKMANGKWDAYTRDELGLQSWVAWGYKTRNEVLQSVSYQMRKQHSLWTA